MVEGTKYKLLVEHLIDACKLEVLSGAEYLKRTIEVPDINRPGLALTGFLQYFDDQRVQVIGMTELSYLNSIEPSWAIKRLTDFFVQKFPCLIITRNLDLPQEWLGLAAKQGLPVLRSELPTTRFIAQLTALLERRLAPSIVMHGVLVDVHGVGILITGDSGIGKSETALELVKRGHRLVADDAVEIIRYGEKQLSGSSPENIRYLMEIRGLGILDIRALFGMGSVRLYQDINMAIQLEEWKKDKYYDRLGLDDDYLDVLEVSIPCVTIPVRPGRNLAGIVEVAAMNFRLKLMGQNPAREFADWHRKLLSEDRRQNDSIY